MIPRGRAWMIPALTAAAGVAGGSALTLWLLRAPTDGSTGDGIAAVGNTGVARVRLVPPREEPSPVVPPPSPAPDAPPELIADPVAALRARRLTLPIGRVTRNDLRSSFDEPRSGSRRHEAMDILAPRNTPIVAVDAGTIAKLFTSKAGGLTIYQFDPTSRFVYYYAHLERYADGLAEQERVRAGQVIGYVGTSGNAPKDTPHLHFAIFKLGEQKRWWEGTPIDPYDVLK